MAGITTTVVGYVYAVIQPFDESMGYTSEIFHTKPDAEKAVKFARRGYIKQVEVRVVVEEGA